MKSAEEKRMQIIQAAIDIFVEKGFEAASIQEVTCATGIAKGTLYLYFPSKEELIHAVFLHCHLLDVQACDEGLEQEKSAVDKLCRRMENAIRWLMDYPREASVERQYFSWPLRREAGPRYADQKHFATVDAIIRAGIVSGELKSLPSVLLGEVFFGIAAAYYYFVQDDPSLLSQTELWKLCRQTVIDCLAR